MSFSVLPRVQILSFTVPVSVAFRKSAGGVTIVFEPGRDYVVSGQQFDRIIQDPNIQARMQKSSRLETRLAPFHFNAKRNGGPQRLLFYNGSGGYGDQIVSWPVAKWLAHHGFEVHVLADPGNQCCWYSFPWVKTIQTLPLPYEQFKMYEYPFILEHVNNLDEHQDQLHPVDTMFMRMGIDPNTIDAAFKVVEPVYTWLEQQIPRQLFADRPIIGIFQLTSANPIRALPPNDTAFLLYRLAEATPDIHWIAIYDEYNNKQYTESLKCRECGGTRTIGSAGTVAAAGTESGSAPPCRECQGTGMLRPNIQTWTSPNLRDLWALTKYRACIVVAPDSLMVHVAGSQSVPCVGLWGPVGPPNRIKYYKNHFPIFHKEACPNSPCFSYLSDFPRYCPPRGGAKRVVCEVLAAVTPHEVIDAVKKIRR